MHPISGVCAEPGRTAQHTSHTDHHYFCLTGQLYRRGIFPRAATRIIVKNEGPSCLMYRFPAAENIGAFTLATTLQSVVPQTRCTRAATVSWTHSELLNGSNFYQAA
jgi:hypothetical protein